MTTTTIALGATHLGASQIYGLEGTELFLADYHEFDPANGLDRVKALRLAAGDGLSSVLKAAVALLENGRDFELSVDYRAGRDAVRDVLQAHPSVTVTGVRPLGGTVVIDLGKVEVPDPRSVALTLTALDLTLENLPATRPAPVAAPAAKPIPRTIPQRDAPRPLRAVNRLIAPLARLSQRKQLIVLAGLSVLVVAVLVGALILIDRSSDGTDAAILVSITIVGQLVTGALLIYVLRAQALDRETHQKMHKRTRSLVARRTGQLGHQGRRIREDVAALNSLRDYVMELARLQAENTVRTEAALERLRTEKPGQ